MKRIFYLIIITFLLSCSKTDLKINKNDIEKWNQDNLTYLNSSCKEFDNSIYKMVLKRTFKDKIRYLLLNELSFSNNENELELIEVYSNEEPSYLIVRLKNNIVDFQIMEAVIEKIKEYEKKEDKLKDWNDELDLLKNKDISLCDEIKLPHTTVTIYTKLEVSNNRIKIIKSILY